MDSETRAVLEAVKSFKRKAPKLRSGDRTISLALETYSPGTSQHQQQAGSCSGIAIDPNLLIDNSLIIPPPPMSSHASSSPIQELRQYVFEPKMLQ